MKNKATLSNKLKEVNAQLIETTELNETLSSKNERLERVSFRVIVPNFFT